MAAGGRRKLTVAVLGSAKPLDTEYVIWDTDIAGFGLRVWPSGRRAWILQRRVRDGRRMRKITIGPTSALGPGAARRRAAALMVEIAAGEDPVAKKREAQRARPTVSQLLDNWLENHVAEECKPKSYDNYAGVVERHLKPTIGNIEVECLHVEDVRELKHRLADRKPTANRCIETLRAAVNWGIAEGTLPDDCPNPAARIKRHKTRNRKVYLEPGELALIMEAIHGEEGRGVVARTACDCLRVLALTGSRRDEIRTARWRNFHGDRLVLDEHKTDEWDDERVILLGPLEIAIITRRRDDSPYDALPGLPIFPGRRWRWAPTPDPVSPQHLQTTWRRVLARARAAGFDRLAQIEERWGGLHIHDLRHSFASIGISNKLTLAEIGQLLGHRSERTTARYAHLLEDAKRKAHTRINTKLMESIGAAGWEGCVDASDSGGTS